MGYDNSRYDKIYQGGIEATGDIGSSYCDDQLHAAGDEWYNLEDECSDSNHACRVDIQIR
jgi:hypothetical protein